MSCQKCEDFQESASSAYYRLDIANIEVRGCNEHLKKMFLKLNSHDALLAACKGIQEWLDTSSLQEVLVNIAGDKQVDALIMGVASHLIRIEAAIANAKPDKDL